MYVRISPEINQRLPTEPCNALFAMTPVLIQNMSKLLADIVSIALAYTHGYSKVKHAQIVDSHAYLIRSLILKAYVKTPI